MCDQLSITKSDPTFGESDDLPDLPAWTRKEPNYLAFRSDGVSVQSGIYFFDFFKKILFGKHSVFRLPEHV